MSADLPIVAPGTLPFIARGTPPYVCGMKEEPDGTLILTVRGHEPGLGGTCSLAVFCVVPLTPAMFYWATGTIFLLPLMLTAVFACIGWFKIGPSCIQRATLRLEVSTSPSSGAVILRRHSWRNSVDLLLAGPDTTFHLCIARWKLAFREREMPCLVLASKGAVQVVLAMTDRPDEIERVVSTIEAHGNTVTHDTSGRVLELRLD